MNMSRISFLAAFSSAFFLVFALQCPPPARADDDLVQTVSNLISDKDKDVRAVGLEQVREEVKGTEATRRFAALLPKLSPDAQTGLLQALADRVSPRVLHAPGRLDTAARELSEYFAGHRRRFGLQLDLRLAAGFRRTVLSHLPEIGYGHTATYAAVAQLAGRPRAFRAVGTACATNPLPVVVPCHRVVRSDGSTGGYLGGPAARRTLLALEAA